MPCSPMLLRAVLRDRGRPGLRPGPEQPQASALGGSSALGGPAPRAARRVASGRDTGAPDRRVHRAAGRTVPLRLREVAGGQHDRRRVEWRPCARCDGPRRSRGAWRSDGRRRRRRGGADRRLSDRHRSGRATDVHRSGAGSDRLAGTTARRHVAIEHATPPAVDRVHLLEIPVPLGPSTAKRESRVVPQGRILDQAMRDVHAKAVDAPIEPKAHDPVDGVAHGGIPPVEIGLLWQEVVEVVLAGTRLERPGGAGTSESLQPSGVLGARSRAAGRCAHRCSAVTARSIQRSLVGTSVPRLERALARPLRPACLVARRPDE